MVCQSGAESFTETPATEHSRVTPKAEATFEILSHGLLCSTHTHPAEPGCVCGQCGGPRLTLTAPGLWRGWGGDREAQEGRDRSPIPPSPNYGFVILLPLEQEKSAPSYPALWPWPGCYTVEGDKVKAPGEERAPLCLGPGQTSGILDPIPQ